MVHRLPAGRRTGRAAAAFGLGLGAHVSGLAVGTEEVSYATYIAPGMLAYTLTPFFQALYGAFIRMHYQKTWEGQATTQIALPHVVWGEVLWAATLGTIYVAIVSTARVCHAGGLVDLDRAPRHRLPLAWICGLAFAAFALCFTAWLPTIDHMTLPVFLVALPLSFTNNTYSPCRPITAGMAATAANPSTTWPKRSVACSSRTLVGQRRRRHRPEPRRPHLRADRAHQLAAALAS